MGENEEQVKRQNARGKSQSRQAALSAAIHEAKINSLERATLRSAPAWLGHGRRYRNRRRREAELRQRAERPLRGNQEFARGAGKAREHVSTFPRESLPTPKRHSVSPGPLYCLYPLTFNTRFSACVSHPNASGFSSGAKISVGRPMTLAKVGAICFSEMRPRFLPGAISGPVAINIASIPG